MFNDYKDTQIIQNERNSNRKQKPQKINAEKKMNSKRTHTNNKQCQ